MSEPSQSAQPTQPIAPVQRTATRTDRPPEILVSGHRHGSRWKPMLVGALLIGIAAGVATSYLQGELPGPSNTLANSGAVWSLVAFVVAFASRQQGGRAALIGAAALLGEVLGYYAVASPLRDIPATNNERLLWVTAALVVGPFVGLAAGWWTGGRVVGRLWAAAIMCGIVLGEGIHGLVRIEFGGVQWWIETVLGAVIGGVAAAHYGRTPFWRVMGILATLAVAAAVYGVYGDTVNRIVFGS